MNLIIDKRDWEKTKLADVVDWYQKDIPNDEQVKYGIQFYVTANHIDGDSVKFDRYNNLEDGQKGPTITKHFQKGDLLLSTRSVALRKAAIAPIDGVTGEKLLVLRVKMNSNLINQLFPFVFQSTDFWEFAQNSASGSVNKFTSWTKIREYEFLLPPKDQQAKLAELLWAMDEVIEREREVLEKLENTYSILVDNLFSKRNENWEYIPLKKIASINKLSLNAKTNSECEFHYLDLTSIVEPKVIGELNKIKVSEAPSRAKRIVSDKSIVLAMVRPYQKAFVYIESGEGIIASTGTAVINFFDNNLIRFAFHQFFSNHFTRYCEDRMTGTSYPAITPKDIEEFKISIPKDKKLILKESIRLDKIELSIFKVKAKIINSKSLQKSLINQIF